MLLGASQPLEGRIVTVCERALTTTVNDIEHTQSESYQGVSVIRVFFQPTVKVELDLSQITAVVQTILRVLPPGTFPPNILQYDASSVPIVQLGLSGQGLTEEDLYDLGLSFIRPRLANVQGASIPLPFGGKVRQVQVDADPNLMYAKHLSALDVSNAFNQQNLILPAGLARIVLRRQAAIRPDNGDNRNVDIGIDILGGLNARADTKEKY